MPPRESPPVRWIRSPPSISKSNSQRSSRTTLRRRLRTASRSSASPAQRTDRGRNRSARSRSPHQRNPHDRDGHGHSRRRSSAAKRIRAPKALAEPPKPAPAEPPQASAATAASATAAGRKLERKSDLFNCRKSRHPRDKSAANCSQPGEGRAARIRAGDTRGRGRLVRQPGPGKVLGAASDRQPSKPADAADAQDSLRRRRGRSFRSSRPLSSANWPSSCNKKPFQLIADLMEA